MPKTSPELKGGKYVQKDEVGGIIQRKFTLSERKRLELGEKATSALRGFGGVLTGKGQRAACEHLRRDQGEENRDTENKYLYISLAFVILPRKENKSVKEMWSCRYRSLCVCTLISADHCFTIYYFNNVKTSSRSFITDVSDLTEIQEQRGL